MKSIKAHKTPLRDRIKELRNYAQRIGLDAHGTVCVSAFEFTKAMNVISKLWKDREAK